MTGIKSLTEDIHRMYLDFTSFCRAKKLQRKIQNKTNVAYRISRSSEAELAAEALLVYQLVGLFVLLNWVL